MNIDCDFTNVQPDWESWGRKENHLPLPSAWNADHMNVLALVKGDERYVFLYIDKERAELLRLLGRFASNPELSFTWYDAAVLSQKIREASKADTEHHHNEQIDEIHEAQIIPSQEEPTCVPCAETFEPPTEEFMPSIDWQPEEREDED